MRTFKSYFFQGHVACRAIHFFKNTFLLRDHTKEILELYKLKFYLKKIIDGHAAMGYTINLNLLV